MREVRDLLNLSSRIGAFRLKTPPRFLNGNGLRWYETAKLLLQKVGRLGYSKHFFLLKVEEVQVTGLTSFYDSVAHFESIHTVKLFIVNLQ